ncbi:Crp/Fnr family transcriptional regulator [Chitinophaga pendula]|uniref:Crp/Fnr family transcriptional regulator n=1 Tax=Chitinophaga TaxID=79328 RepID=UPI0018DF2F2B|nr:MULTISPECIES: Crp/Fnr family transcriptional regulator [Chitinophaga]UCJ07408.1 Crp/Fnr family transcriptional regulator [Chitinophaga pendula]
MQETIMRQQLRQHIEKIVPLTDDEFEFIVTHFSIRHAKKREFVFKQGDAVEYTYFVVAGLLKLVFEEEESGKQHIVAFAMEDWWESDFLAFYSRTKATMSLQCIEETSMYCLTWEGYQQLCAGSRKMEHFFLIKANYGISAHNKEYCPLLLPTQKIAMSNSSGDILLFSSEYRRHCSHPISAYPEKPLVASDALHKPINIIVRFVTRQNALLYPSLHRTNYPLRAHWHILKE